MGGVELVGGQQPPAAAHRRAPGGDVEEPTPPETLQRRELVAGRGGIELIPDRRRLDEPVLDRERAGERVRHREGPGDRSKVLTVETPLCGVRGCLESCKSVCEEEEVAQAAAVGG